MADTRPAGPPPLPTDWRKWVLGARPRTLPAAVAPVLVGTAAAAGLVLRDGPKGLVVWRFLCALGVALFVQVATNYANDYSDGKRGTDDPGARTGPPRLVGNGLATPGQVKRAMLACFGLTAVCGLPLVLFVDWKLVFVGLAAIAAGWFYTGGSRPYGYAGFGEVVRVRLLRPGGHRRVLLRPDAHRHLAGGAVRRGHGLPVHRAAGGEQPAGHPGRHRGRQGHPGGAAGGPADPDPVRRPGGAAVPGAAPHGRPGGPTAGRPRLRGPGPGPSARSSAS